MKKLLSFLLALCLCVGAAAPAMAETAPETNMEQALAEITAIAKETLRVDDDYTEFYGDYYEDLIPTWYLNWSDEERTLSVTCDGEGMVLDVYAYTYSNNTDRFYGFDPAFPALTEEEARTQAEEWLARFMGEGESARIDRTSSTLGEDASYRYYGTVLLNGLESPITFSIRIDKNGLRSYSRSDSYNPYVGDVPAAEAEVGQLAAAVHLASAVEMELYYVYDDAAGEARLQYVPVGPYTVVDAQSGESVDMDALYASLEENGMGGYATMDMAAAEAESVSAYRNAGGLSEMELASIANYGEVLEQEEIDGLLRGISALGITEDFSIARCSYAMDSGTGDVTASLRYTATLTEDNLYGFSRDEFRQYREWGDTLTITKYISVNAKTGELLSVSTSYPLWEKDPGEFSPSDLRTAADDFLAEVAPAMAEKVAVCTLSAYEERDGFTYARVENDYFYPENYLYVSLNSATCTVDSYYYKWDEDVTFASAKNILTAAEAAAAYVGALEVTLGYVAWPEEIRRDDPQLLRYIEWGYTWVESLRLAWYFGDLAEVEAVDALTGEVLRDGEEEDGSYTYTDLSGVAQQEAIEALAQAGIGFAGGKFEADKALTQREAVVLLLQAAGYDVSSWEDELLCSEAEYQGFLTGETWEPDSTVTRMDFLKMMLGASRYGDAAALTGVWTCTFTDVSGDDVAYGALAQALGLADGKKLDPEGTCSRGMAAEFLAAFMSR